jgi:acetylornithine/succinyldiaminopimelate/putrescine aminotransferase
LHGSTFGGNPVSCAASLEVLKLLTPRALRQIEKIGNDAKQKLSAFRRYKAVKEVRGRGLMLALELGESGDPYVAAAREKGLLINCTQGTVLRFLPPYFIKQRDLDRCISILDSVFRLKEIYG